MGRRLYKPGALVESRNTKFDKGFGIILTGPHDEKPWYSAEHTIEKFMVHWFKRPTPIERWEWNRTDSKNFKMTKNQIKIVL